jgi:hypothetical protein
MARTHPWGARHAAALLVAATFVVACSSAPPSVAPSAAPTPLITPNPHLPTVATAQQVFSGLRKARLNITANTAKLGMDGSDVVTKIYATYLGWPLDVTQFRSASALSDAIDWPAGEEPGRGEPPIALAGGNILITWGPAVSGKMPSKPDSRQSGALEDLVAAVDILLAPLQARTNVPVKVTEPAVSASPLASPSAAAPTKAPSKAPGKASPTKKPKATTKP